MHAEEQGAITMKVYFEGLPFLEFLFHLELVLKSIARGGFVIHEKCKLFDPPNSKQVFGFVQTDRNIAPIIFNHLKN